MIKKLLLTALMAAIWLPLEVLGEECKIGSRTFSVPDGFAVELDRKASAGKPACLRRF